MTRFVVMSVDASRLRNMRKLLPDFEVFEGTTGCTSLDFRQICIPDTYRRLAELAVAEQWDRDTVVLMDDVWIPNGPGFDRWQHSYDTSLLVFGQTMADGYIDPRAFSATTDLWMLLSAVWRGEGRIWADWDPVVKEHGLVLDLTRFML